MKSAPGSGSLPADWAQSASSSEPASALFERWEGVRQQIYAAQMQLADEVVTRQDPIRVTQLETSIEMLGGQGTVEGALPLLDSLEQYGMIAADEDGRYNEHSLKATRSAVVLATHGLEPRHLRPFRAAADRELGLIERVTAPLASRRDSAAGARVAETAREISEACLGLHSALVGAAVAELDS